MKDPAGLVRNALLLGLLLVSIAQCSKIADVAHAIRERTDAPLYDASARRIGVTSGGIYNA